MVLQIPTRIDEIVDASAAVAATYISGVKVVWGIGSGKITVPHTSPVWADKLIKPWTGNTPEPGTHVSDMPDAPKITYDSGTVLELHWRVPMRLYVAQAPNENARRICAPFYGQYLAAFLANAMLFGTCNSAEIEKFDLFNDKEGTGYCGIAVLLSVWERWNVDVEEGPPLYPFIP